MRFECRTNRHPTPLHSSGIVVTRSQHCCASHGIVRSGVLPLAYGYWFLSVHTIGNVHIVLRGLFRQSSSAETSICSVSRLIPPILEASSSCVHDAGFWPAVVSMPYPKVTDLLSHGFLSVVLHHYNAVQHIFSPIPIGRRGLVGRLYSALQFHSLCVACVTCVTM